MRFNRDHMPILLQRSEQTAIDPRVEPRTFRRDAEGRVVVSVHQVVRDLSGAVLADQIVEHVYEMQDGLVCRMEIR